MPVPVVTVIDSGNPAFTVLEVSVPGTALPAHRASIANAAIASGAVDLNAVISTLKAEAALRYDNWLAAQAVLAGLQL
jgi:hypothetical protein